MSRIPLAARNLLQRVTSDGNQFGTLILFEDNNGRSATASGFVIKATPTLGYDASGKAITVHTRRLTVGEGTLVAAGYIVRDPVTNNISMFNHRCTYTDDNGITGTYIVKETRPSETVGMILIILNETSTPKVKQ